MTKKILGFVLCLLLVQVLGYHLFSRSLLITRVMEDQEFALINYPDSIFVGFCNFGEQPVVGTNDYLDDINPTEFEDVSQDDTFSVVAEADSSYLLIEEDLEEADEIGPPSNYLPPHDFNYSEIPSLSGKEQLLIDKHIRRKSRYVKFPVNEGDYLNSGFSKYFVYHLCLDKVFFIGRVEEMLIGHAPDIGYYESWNSTYIWVLFTWVKIDRHGTGIS